MQLVSDMHFKKANANSVHSPDRNSSHFKHLQNIGQKHLSQLHVHITGKTLFLLQRIFDANSMEIHMYITYMCLWVTIV